jgi:hypothetical protein
MMFATHDNSPDATERKQPCPLGATEEKTRQWLQADHH